MTQDLLAEALVALRNGEVALALSHLTQACEAENPSAEALYLRAIALARLAQTNDALTAARRCLALHLGYPPALELIDHLEQLYQYADTKDHVVGDTASWQVGQLISDRWEVFGGAAGGMGRVYFVRDRSWDGVELAVKTLPQTTLSPEQLARAKSLFLRESQVWLDLGAHPHIVSGFYTIELDGALRFFMEYVPGLSLDAVLAQTPTLPLAWSLDIAIQLAAGMEYVHARGVVHRDLKPHNCLVTQDGTVKITDFGLGKVMGEADEPSPQRPDPNTADSRTLPFVTRHSRLGAGTAEYMPPEQWLGLGRAQRPADVYAFGIMLYQLFTGERPFGFAPAIRQRYAARAPTHLRQLMSAPELDPVCREAVEEIFHRYIEPLAPSALGVTLPAGLDALLLSCLSKAPEQRPTFGALRLSLLDCFQESFGAYPRELPGALLPSEAGENNRALSYFAMGQAEKAGAILDAWLVNHPSALYPWLNRQCLSLQQGTLDEAEVEERLRRELWPTHSQEISLTPALHALWQRLSRGVSRLEPASLVAATSDGSYFLLANHERVISYDPKTQTKRVVGEHRGVVTALALSANGALGVTASEDRTACLWELPGGLLVRVLLVGDVISGAAVSAQLAAFSGGAVQLWDVNRGRLSLRLSDETTAKLSPDGERLITQGKAVHLYEAKSGRLLRSLKELNGPARATAFSPDGQLVAAITAEGQAHLWESSTGKPRLSLNANAPLTTLAISHLNDQLMLGCPNGRVLLFAISDGALLRERRGDPGLLLLGFTADDQQLWTLSQTGTLRYRDVYAEAWPFLLRRDFSVQQRLSHAKEKEQLVARLNADDLSALAPLQMLRQQVPELRREREVWRALHRVGVRFGVSPSLAEVFLQQSLQVGARVRAIFGEEDNTWVLSEAGLHRLSIITGTTRLVAAISGATCAALSPNQRWLVVGSKDKLLRLFDTQREALLWTAAGHAQGLTSLAFSPDGESILAASDEKVLRLWRTQDGVLLRVTGAVVEVLTVALFSRNGQRWISGSAEGTLRIWDAARAAPLWQGRSARAVIRALCPTPDGLSVLVGTGEDLACWSLSEGKRRWAYQAHEGRIHAIDTTPDGALLVTCGKDQQAVLCEAPHPDGPRKPLSAHSGDVRAAAFLDDGRLLLTGDDAGVVRVWGLDRAWSFPSI